MHLPEKEPDLDKGAPSASNTRRFPEDQLLRLNGWQIYSRPKSGPALWRYGNAILPQEKALAIIRHEKEKADAVA